MNIYTVAKCNFMKPFLVSSVSTTNLPHIQGVGP